ncbi:MAG: DUF721 domain-containing protein [Acidobacteria bacterium]|nr:DUF721 domain-containing protein [Acidobacteriota bacterium]
MKPLGNFMAQLARDFCDQPVLVEIILKGQWQALLGKRISSNSLPVAFRDGVLQVAASDERWLAELSRLSEDIRARLNKFFGKEVVKSIQFVQKT